MKILTFDIEEWFHILENEATDGEKQWEKLEVRIYRNVERILALLEESKTPATFFVIGWIARQYPDLVRRIAERYEVASHTDSHRLVSSLSPEAFRQDLRSSIHRLEDITGQEITTFRAPGFSIGEKEHWALGILAEEGIRCDCSIFPRAHAHGGYPGFPANGPCRIRYAGATLHEFPMPSHRVLRKEIVFAGGGYFRMWPYSLIRRWTREMPDDYLLSYIHPRDLDATQPPIPGVSPWRRIKSRWGIRTAEDKLRRYLQDFRFTDLRGATQSIIWDETPLIDWS